MHVHNDTTEAGASPAPLFPAFGLVERLARYGAIIGGAVLLLMALVTCASVVSRLTVGRPFLGIFEMVELFTGIAVLSFFPYTHITRGNVMAEFFTQSAPRAVRAALDLIADLAFVAIAAFLFWRVGAGFLESLHSLDRSFVLNLPEWVFYGPAVLWLFLLLVVAVAIAGESILKVFK